MATVFASAPGLLIRTHITKLMLVSPSLSNRAHASPVWPVPVHWSVWSHDQNSLYVVASVSSRPIWVRSLWAGTSLAPCWSVTTKKLDGMLLMPEWALATPTASADAAPTTARSASQRGLACWCDLRSVMRSAPSGGWTASPHRSRDRPTQPASPGRSSPVDRPPGGSSVQGARAPARSEDRAGSRGSSRGSRTRTTRSPRPAGSPDRADPVTRAARHAPCKYGVRGEQRWRRDAARRALLARAPRRTFDTRGASRRLVADPGDRRGRPAASSRSAPSPPRKGRAPCRPTLGPADRPCRARVPPRSPQRAATSPRAAW